jgi:hypothetical protein
MDANRDREWTRNKKHPQIGIPSAYESADEQELIPTVFCAPRFPPITNHQSRYHGFGLLALAFDVAVDFGEDEVGG